MTSRLSRRNFLKLSASVPAAAAAIRHLQGAESGSSAAPKRPNVLILILDALSAKHISLYGYPRQTTPNLDSLAERSVVYHAHYAAANFTTPGIGSILTGTYPWAHRGFQLSAKLLPEFAHRNVFAAFSQAGYSTFGFSQNKHANVLLDQFRSWIDHFVPPSTAAWADFNFADDVFFRDYGVAFRPESWYLKRPFTFSSSLFISLLYDLLARQIGVPRIEKNLQQKYPRGLPNHDYIFFPLEDTVAWLSDFLKSLATPFLGYVHLMPPHDPYLPSSEFVGRFDDGFQVQPKPPHAFSTGEKPEQLASFRQDYDEFIAYADANVGRLLDSLETDGLLADTCLVITSDHGEMFERGIWSHWTPTLFEPILRVPLLIAAPGRHERLDIQEPSSAVDLLPTLMRIAGIGKPDWSEGSELPPYGPEPRSPNRAIFAVEAKQNPKRAPFQQATFAMRKGDSKLIYYLGYPEHDRVYELFHLRDDPEELVQLFGSDGAASLPLTDELLAKIEDVNKAYR